MERNEYLNNKNLSRKDKGWDSIQNQASLLKLDYGIRNIQPCKSGCCTHAHKMKITLIRSAAVTKLHLHILSMTVTSMLCLVHTKSLFLTALSISCYCLVCSFSLCWFFSLFLDTALHILLQSLIAARVIHIPLFSHLGDVYQIRALFECFSVFYWSSLVG